MKRIISLILLLCFVFSLVSCAAKEILTETKESPTQSTEQTTEKNNDASTRTLDLPVTPGQALEAIPVAKPGMSVEELREICTDYMRVQTSIPWIPAETYQYVIDEQHDRPIFRKNTVYGGLPYTHNSTSLYTFLDFYDEETGILSLPNRTYIETIIGNNCADAVFWAWGRFSSTISFTGTVIMLEKYGVLRVGSYTYPDSIESFANYSTKRICEENGKNTMYESYALIKKGDGFVNYIEQGHTFIASCDAVVVRNANGTINPDESYAVILEQHSNQVKRSLETTQSQYQDIISRTPVVPNSEAGNASGDATVNNIGGVDNKFTFSTLFQMSYLPVTCAELCGKEVENAHAEVENLPESASSVADLRNCNVTSNFRISKVSYSFADSEGNVVFETSEYGKEASMYSHPVALSQPALQRGLTKGQSYTLTISALVATGEELVAGTCNFSM